MFSCSGGSNGRESEPFSVILRSPLRASCQQFFEELPHPRKYRADISREPAFFRQCLKRDLPIHWRRNQTGRQIVRSSSLKCQTQGVENSLFIESTRSDQESKVHEVLHPAVLSTPRERVCMDLFGELLLASDHPNARRRDASESQPVA